MRPDWDTYFFQIAGLVASRATCPRAAIGAVLVKNKRIIGTGYNGVPEGRPHCPDTLEHLALEHCPDAVHAEYNALANALVPAFGATLYVVGPRRICPDCADRLHENGVVDIRSRPSVPTLDTVLAEVVTWQRTTFPGEQVLPAIVHLFRELRELDREPASGEEHADALMLSAAVRDRVVRSAQALGIDLKAETARKLAICRRRDWGEPDAHGVVEHVRAGGAS